MDFSYFEQWVLKEYKINLSAYKSNQLHRRIESLMSRVGVKNIDEYISLLKREPAQKQKFLDFITINVSEFFRNPEIFEDLKQKIKGGLLNPSKPLKIWSAACSMGAEPYSLAMLLDELSTGVRHRIIATDIDLTILDKAKKGEYNISEIKNVKKEFLSKYFIASLVGNGKIKESVKLLENEKYTVNDKIKSLVTFKKHDLILERYENDLDLIVCRNVVIYFNQDTKEEIYSKFSQSLKTGGLLFVGATESIYNYKDYGFEKVSTFIYRKI